MGAWPQSRTCQPSLGKGREEGRQRGEDRWQVAGVAIGGFPCWLVWTLEGWGCCCAEGLEGMAL